MKKRGTADRRREQAATQNNCLDIFAAAIQCEDQDLIQITRIPAFKQFDLNNPFRLAEAIGMKTTLHFVSPFVHTFQKKMSVDGMHAMVQLKEKTKLKNELAHLLCDAMVMPANYAEWTCCRSELHTTLLRRWLSYLKDAMRQHITSGLIRQNPWPEMPDDMSRKDDFLEIMHYATTTYDEVDTVSLCYATIDDAMGKLATNWTALLRRYESNIE